MGIKDHCRWFFFLKLHVVIDWYIMSVTSFRHSVREPVLIFVVGLVRRLGGSNAYQPSSFSLVLFLIFGYFYYNDFPLGYSLGSVISLRGLKLRKDLFLSWVAGEITFSHCYLI